MIIDQYIVVVNRLMMTFCIYTFFNLSELHLPLLDVVYVGNLYKIHMLHVCKQRY